MMRKTLSTVALGGALAVAAGCTTTTTSLDRGNAYYRDGQYSYAAAEFHQAVSENPDWATPYVNRGVARVRLGRLDTALDDYNRALALDPNDPAIYFNRGNALVAAGLYLPAIEDFTRAVELSPPFAKAWFNRGSARALAGQRERAMQDWLHAIELESDPWARAAMRRSAGLEPSSAVVSMRGTPTTATTVAPAPSPGMATAARPLPPAGAPPTAPAASPSSPASVDARTLAIRAISREIDGDHEGALMDLRAALAIEQDPARRQSLEELLRKLEASR
jgi:tetratricopeptide (TPR) repeat protein